MMKELRCMLPIIINIIQCLASHLSLQEFNILIMINKVILNSEVSVSIVVDVVSDLSL